MGAHRFAFNWTLHLRSTAWKERKESLNFEATSAALTELKRQPEVEWLNEVGCVPVQQSLRHLQVAFVNFWNHGASYPRFYISFQVDDALAPCRRPLARLALIWA